MKLGGVIWLAALAVAGLGACRSSSEGDGAADPRAPDRLAPLRAFEKARRAEVDFARLPASHTTLGADPYDLSSLPDSGRLVGILRGRSEVVLLDADLTELGRAPSPTSPTGLAVGPRGEIFVSGELSRTLERYRVVEGKLTRAGAVALADMRVPRAVAIGDDGIVHVLDEHDGRLVSLRLERTDDSMWIAERRDVLVGAGPVKLERIGSWLVVDCLLDHSLVILGVDADGFADPSPRATIEHDGPIWSFDAVERSGDLLIAAGGVEDHPLDRTIGSFGHIDSFVYLYRVRGGAVVRLSAVNVSAHGVVTPKTVRLVPMEEGGAVAELTAYGSARGATVTWNGELSDPAVETFELPPGTSASVARPDGSRVVANPLLDAWVVSAGDDLRVVPVAPRDRPARSEDSRLGEALFFTTLMAPWNRSEGPLSRFSCETCHFEGYVDGRTHHTGRGNVRATTKPLLGLFNNRPHFSRSLDRDLTKVAHNEFRVAGANSGHEPWFTLETRQHEWMAHLGVTASQVGPERLRRALMTFLMDFTHRPNPATFSRARWTSEERAGAEVFAERCERCHAARLASDVPETRQPVERWEALTMSSEGPIVWGRDGYEKTGVEPYVHADGARSPSLRRLYKKRPYFTNGSAADLPAVLDAVRFGDGQFFHRGARDDPTLSALDARERRVLLAFLDLL